MRVWVGMLVVMMMARGAFALGLEVKGKDAVHCEMAADVSAVTAGTPFQVAIVTTVSPGWHIYWKNPGDAGVATKFEFKVPAGFKAELQDFPMPTSFSSEGVTAYGYAGKTVFLARITPPKELAAGKVAVGVDVSWLVCKDACVPGAKKLMLELPVAEAGKAGAAANKELFEAARAEIPLDAPPAEMVATMTPEDHPNPKGGRGTFYLRIGWKKEVKDVAVFPLAMEGVEVSEMKAESAKDQSTVTFAARVLAGQKMKEGKLGLLVTYKDAAGKRHGFYSDVDLHAIAAGVK